MSSSQAFAGPAFSRGSPASRHPFWESVPEILDDLDRVRDRVMAEAAAAGGAVGEALGRYVGRPGKMLRPGLVLVGSWAGTAHPDRPAADRIVRIAAAIETLHLATLVHDDVIDDADQRRGEPSLHSLHGRKQAVLMGDYLLSRCFAMVAEDTSRETALSIATATGHLVRGEIGQSYHASEERFSRRAYLRRIAGKTAMLFGVSLVSGAAETKAKRRETALLARAGYCIGMAFQIIDDLLDLTSVPEALGKPAAADLRSGIYTLPVIEAVAAEPGIRRHVVPPPATEQAMDETLAAIGRTDGLARARQLAGLYTQRAQTAVSRLASDPQREALARVARRLLVRSY